MLSIALLANIFQLLKNNFFRVFYWQIYFTISNFFSSSIHCILLLANIFQLIRLMRRTGHQSSFHKNLLFKVLKERPEHSFAFCLIY